MFMQKTVKLEESLQLWRTGAPSKPNQPCFSACGTESPLRSSHQAEWLPGFVSPLTSCTGSARIYIQSGYSAVIKKKKYPKHAYYLYWSGMFASIFLGEQQLSENAFPLMNKSNESSASLRFTDVILFLGFTLTGALSLFLPVFFSW